MRTLHKSRYKRHILRTASVPIQVCDFCTVIKPNINLFTESSLSFQSRTQFKASSTINRYGSFSNPSLQIPSQVLLRLKSQYQNQVKYYSRKPQNYWSGTQCKLTKTQSTSLVFLICFWFRVWVFFNNFSLCLVYFLNNIVQHFIKIQSQNRR